MTAVLNVYIVGVTRCIFDFSGSPGYAMICSISLFILVLWNATDFIGNCCFLGDQLDQILHLKYLFKGHWHLLYGPVFSNTSPPVYSLGSIPNLFYGVPSALGLNPNQMQFFHMVLISLAGIPLFFKMRKINLCAGYSYLAILFTAPIYWWGLTILWLNNFQLIFSLLFLAGFLHYFEKPSGNRAVLTFGIWLLAIQIHSTPLMAAPLAIIPIIHIIACRKRCSLKLNFGSLLFLAALIAPYILAECLSSFQNTKAIALYFAQSGQKASTDAGYVAAVKAFQNLFGFIELSAPSLQLEATGSWQNLLKWCLPLVFCAWLLVRFFKSMGRIFRSQWNALDILWLGIFLSLGLQFIFFLAVKREIMGPQYVIFSAPMIICLWAGFFGDLLSRAFKKSEIAVLATSCLAIILLFPHRTTRIDRSDWNFDHAYAAVKEVCDRSRSFQAPNQPAFTGYQDYYENLFTYVAHTYFEDCRVTATADNLLLPDRGSLPPKILNYKGEHWRRVKVMKPQIALYERVSTAKSDSRTKLR